MKRIGIIGRTNVGKSTLFNLLIKQKKSIVSDVAGTTRDFISGNFIIGAEEVELLDFGGFAPANGPALDRRMPDEIINSSVQKNILDNIKDLDLIIFIVDGRCDISDEDIKIADMIRKSKKPVIVAVNKVESKKQEDNFYDYFSLGFENVIPISAANNKNIDQILETISKILKLKKNKKISVPKKHLTKIAIIGKPNVGKSSLFNFLYGSERNIVTDIAGTTRDSVDAKINLEGDDYIFIDTAGLRRKTKISEGLDKESSYSSIRSISNTDIVLYLVDVNSYATSYDIKLLGYAWRKGKPIIVVVNKWDIKPRDMTEKKFKDILIADNSMFKYFSFVFTSSVRGSGVDKLIQEIKRVEQKLIFEIKTSLLNKELRDIFSTIANMNQKFYYATQTNKNPIEILLFVNKNRFFTKKFIEILEKKLREKLDLMGIPLFIKLREKEVRS